MVGTGGISVDGLISGLDTTSIIDQLIAVQSQNILRLQGQKLDETDTINLFQQLQAAALGLLTASDSLSRPSLFEGKNALSTDTSIIRVTALDSAAVGSHDVTVVQLAAKNQYVTNRFASENDSSGITGDIVFTVGEGADAITTSITVNDSNNTFKEIADAINLSGAKISAQIVQVDSSNSPYRIILDADGAGSAGAFTVSFTNTSFVSTVTDEEAGTGKGIDTSSTDDSDAKTFAFTTARANPGSTITVKVGATAGAATTIQATMSTPVVSTIANADAGGDLQADTVYYYKVTAVDVTGETLGSEIVSIATGAGGNTQQNTLTYGAVTGATSYNIYFSLSPDFSGSMEAGSTAATSFTHDDQGDGGTLTVGAPPTTATQGYTINNDTGTVTFNADISGGDNVYLSYEHGGIVFDESQEAKDAILKLGTGDSSFTITKNSNTIDDLFEGVTLKLQDADATKTITIDISKNNFGVDTAVQALVKSVNDVLGFIQENSFYDPDTGATGPFLSDPNVFIIQNRLSAILNAPVKSIAPVKIRALSQIGVSLNPDTGSYKLDSSKLTAALSDTPEEVKNFFASLGIASDSDVQVLAFSDKTIVTSSNGYTVAITKAALRAENTGIQDISSGITVDETLTFKFGSTEIEVDLTNGTSALSAVAAINSAFVNAGIEDTRAVYTSSTGKITVRTDEYGSDQSFSIKSTVANTTSGTSGLGAENAGGEVALNGRDVVGTINGESATGEGQLLKGDSGNVKTDGLQLLITVSQSQLDIQGFSQGTAVVSKGLGGLMKNFLSFLTDTTQEGPIQSSIAEANGRIEDLEAAIKTANERADRERVKLLREFARLEQALGSLQSTSTFLTGQLAQFAANSQAFASRRPGR